MKPQKVTLEIDSNAPGSHSIAFINAVKYAFEENKPVNISEFDLGKYAVKKFKQKDTVYTVELALTE